MEKQCVRQFQTKAVFFLRHVVFRIATMVSLVLHAQIGAP
jgi:hypothetical protein